MKRPILVVIRFSFVTGSSGPDVLPSPAAAARNIVPLPGRPAISVTRMETSTNLVDWAPIEFTNRSELRIIPDPSEPRRFFRFR